MSVTRLAVRSCAARLDSVPASSDHGGPAASGHGSGGPASAVGLEFAGTRAGTQRSVLGWAIVCVLALRSVAFSRFQFAAQALRTLQDAAGRAFRARRASAQILPTPWANLEESWGFLGWKLARNCVHLQRAPAALLVQTWLSARPLPAAQRLSGDPGARWEKVPRPESPRRAPSPAGVRRWACEHALRTPSSEQSSAEPGRAIGRASHHLPSRCKASIRTLHPALRCSRHAVRGIACGEPKAHKPTAQRPQAREPDTRRDPRLLAVRTVPYAGAGAAAAAWPAWPRSAAHSSRGIAPQRSSRQVAAAGGRAGGARGWHWCSSGSCHPVPSCRQVCARPHRAPHRAGTAANLVGAYGAPWCGGPASA